MNNFTWSIPSISCESSDIDPFRISSKYTIGVKPLDRTQGLLAPQTHNIAGIPVFTDCTLTDDIITQKRWKRKGAYRQDKVRTQIRVIPSEKIYKTPHGLIMHPVMKDKLVTSINSAREAEDKGKE